MSHKSEMKSPLDSRTKNVVKRLVGSTDSEKSVLHYYQRTDYTHNLRKSWNRNFDEKKWKPLWKLEYSVELMINFNCITEYYRILFFVVEFTYVLDGFWTFVFFLITEESSTFYTQPEPEIQILFRRISQSTYRLAVFLKYPALFPIL